MLNTVVKLILRNFKKTLLYTIINLVGLAVGIACFVLVSYYVMHEFTFDTSYKNSDRIYRINFINADGNEFANTPSALARHLREELPEVKKVARIFAPYSSQNSALILIDDRQFYDPSIAFVDSTFLSMFDVTFTIGSPKEFSDPNSVFLSASTAEKIFGETDPIGQTIRISRDQFTVAGIFEDFPSNSHIDFHYLINLERRADLHYQWQYWQVLTYVQLFEVANAPGASPKVKDLVSKHAGANFLEFWNGFTFRLQPLTAIHFTPGINYDLGVPTSTNKLYIVWLVGLLILVLAIANYINLSMSRMAERLKEIAIAKSLGAVRKSLAIQYFTENLFAALMASVLSAILIVSLYPKFAELVNTSLLLSTGSIYTVGALLIISAVVVALLASIYPSVLITQANPGLVLRSQSSIRAMKSHSRKVFLIIQCAGVTFLLACAVVIDMQLNFLLTTSPGFDKEHVLLVRMRNIPAENQESLKAMLAQHSAISSVARTSTPLGSNMGMWGFSSETIPDNDPRGIIHITYVDRDFLKVMDIPIMEGKTFEQEGMPHFKRDLIVNEALLKNLEIKNPIGHHLNTVEMEGTIIGVTKDFSFHSMEESVQPLVMATQTFAPDDTSRAPYRYLAIKTSANQSAAALEFAQQTWKQINPTDPFEYYFQDEHFNKLHQKQAELKKLFSICSVLAVLIGAFGLFAFTSYACKQRVREIAIRKVMGASVGDLMWTISVQSLKLVAIGLLLALPLSAYAIYTWLQGQAFRIAFTIFPFLITGFVILVFAMIVILSEVIKASTRNPITAIRSE